MLTTDRLTLRRWQRSDREILAEMNADPHVMEFFPEPLGRADSDAQADRIERHIEEHGFGFWALELPGRAPFIGFAGLVTTRFSAHFTPCIEVGWRLGHAYWGQGYATEAAKRALQFGFEELGLKEIVSFTVAANRRSRAVMERIGMKHDKAGDFDHPLVPRDWPFKRHVLYRIAP